MVKPVIARRIRSYDLHPGSDLDKPRTAECRRFDRDGETSRRSNGRPERDASFSGQGTRPESRQLSNIVRKHENPSSGTRNPGLDLKRGSDQGPHQRIMDEAKRKRREVAKGSREETDRSRESNRVRIVSKDGKQSVEDHRRQDKRGPRERGDLVRAGEVQDGLDKGGSSSQVMKDEERRGSQHVRDVRQNRESGNRMKVDQRGDDAVSRHKGSGRSLQLGHPFRNLDRQQGPSEGMGNGSGKYRGGGPAAYAHRPNKKVGAYASDEGRRREHQEVQREGNWHGRRLENGMSFSRSRGNEDLNERSIHRHKSGVDEGVGVFRRHQEDRRYGQGNADHMSRAVRRTDLSRNLDVRSSNHEDGTHMMEDKGFESVGKPRFSSKVVIPSRVEDQAVEEGTGNDGEGTDAKPSVEAEKQEVESQEIDRKLRQKRCGHKSNVTPLGDEKSSVREENVETSASARLRETDSNNGKTTARKEASQRSKADPIAPNDSKHADRDRRRNPVEEPREQENPTKENSAPQEIPSEGKSKVQEEYRENVAKDAAAKHHTHPTDRDGQEGRRDAAEVQPKDQSQEKQHKDVGKKRQRSDEALVRRKAAKLAREKRDDPSHDRKHRTRRSRSRSISPRRQKWPKSTKEPARPISPRRFERERAHTTSSYDNRYRRFGGGKSGLGGYSPRRRRSDAAIKTPSPPPRSPERKRVPTWDSIPPGMDSTMIAAISAAHHAAMQHALVTLAAVGPLGNGSILVSPVATSTSAASSALPTVPSMMPSLLPQVNSAVTTVTLTQATRPLRRLYVGNVPSTVSDGELLEFMNAAMLSANANHLPGTKPCINCSVNVEKSHAFAEFITPEDATAALAFDGVTLHGTTLKFRRPKDFVLPSNVGTESASPGLDMVSNRVPDSRHKVFVGGIPLSLTADKVKEIVTAFGQLKAYHWELDTTTKPSQAFAFLEYMDPAATLNACAGLNGMRLGSGYLTVVQATPDAVHEVAGGRSNLLNYGIPQHAKPLLEPPSRVLELQNLVSADEVQNLSKEDVDELLEDVRLECSRFGSVKSSHLVQPGVQPDTEIGFASPGKVEGIPVKIVRGVNLNYGHVAENLPEEMAEDDDLGEEPPMQQTVTGSEMPSSPVGGSVSAASGEGKEQSLVTDVGDQVPTDGHKRVDNCKNESDGHVTDSNATSAGLAAPSLQGPAQSPENHSNESHSGADASRPESRGPGEMHEKPVDGPVHDSTAGGALTSFSHGSMTEEGKIAKREWETAHAGNVYVEFSREEAACQAAHALHGRVFGGQKVAICYFPLRLYQKKFHKGMGPRTFQEKQALALAVQGHLTAHIKD